jgi:polyisoprenyl-phosphate glycosyltransferase
MSAMTQNIALVTPVLDDWPSFAALIVEISDLFAGSDFTFHIYAVDDGSSAPFDRANLSLPLDSCIVAIDVIRLALNLGHQRAIAIGLCEIADGDDIDMVLVMDCDGEDRPVDIAALLAAIGRHPGHVVFAGRAKRSESRGFRLCYLVYKMLFQALTGESISFGNYSLIPKTAVCRLVHMPELWNNLAASVMRSRLPYVTVPTIRGRRLSGQSTMNFVSLAVHGLTAMSAYSDTILVRGLFAAASLAGLSCVGMVGVALIRTLTDLAIPGWATTMVGDLLIVLLQSLVIMVAATLTMLTGRSIRPIIPIVDFHPFVAGRERCRVDRSMTLPTAA